MDSGESLGIYLQTIRTLMNSRIYQQQDNSNKSELEIQEEQEFLSQLTESLLGLQEKLRSDRLEKDEEYEEQKERQNELINQLQTEAEILEQENQELQKVIFNEEDQHFQMTQSLAKSQMENFQSSQILQELDNEFYEGNKYKIKSEEMNLQNKLMKEKKLQLLNQEKLYKSQIEDQHSLIKKLHKDHLQIEAQYRMFERKLNKMKKEQEESMYENKKQKQTINQMQSQCKQLVEQNQALIAQRDSLQYQIEEALADHNIIMPLDHTQSNVHQQDHDYFYQNQLMKNTSNNNYDHIVTSLKDELGDQFSDTFFSPISSVTETDRDDLHMGYHKSNRFNGITHPFMLDEQQNNNYYESSGGTTEQSSTNTRSSEPPNPKSVDNPIKHLNKVILASDFDNQNQEQNEAPQEEIVVQQNSESQETQVNNHQYNLPNGFIGKAFQRKQNGKTSDTPKKLNQNDMQFICQNLMCQLTYKPLISLNSKQIIQ